MLVECRDQLTSRRAGREGENGRRQVSVQNWRCSIGKYFRSRPSKASDRQPVQRLAEIQKLEFR